MLLQIGEPLQGKRKIPEPGADEDGESDQEDLTSEDAPLPGEEDTEDSDESDADTLQHGHAMDSIDEDEESEDEEMQVEPASKTASSAPRNTADRRRVPEALNASGEDKDDD